MKGEKQNVKTYKLNKDFTVECVMGDTMEVRVIIESLPWRPVIEEVVGISCKEEGNRVFKEMVAKYREDAYSSVILKPSEIGYRTW